MIIEVVFSILVANIATNFIIKTCCKPIHEKDIIIESLDTIAPIIKEKGDLIYDSCSICFESFIDIDIIRKTKCNHPFCNDCIKEWLDKSNKCPLCNQELISILN